MDKQQILTQMENLLEELVDNYKPNFVLDGPVGTTLDVITTKELNATQRVIMLYLLFECKHNEEAILQRDIVEDLGFSNKCIRENMETLQGLGYVKRGSKIYTWYPL